MTKTTKAKLWVTRNRDKELLWFYTKRPLENQGDNVSRSGRNQSLLVPTVSYAALFCFLFFIASDINGQTTHRTAIMRRIQDTGRVKNSA